MASWILVNIGSGNGLVPDSSHYKRNGRSNGSTIDRRRTIAPVPLMVLRSNSKFDQFDRNFEAAVLNILTNKIGRGHFKPEHCKFWSNFEFDRNMVSGTGAWSLCNIGYPSETHLKLKSHSTSFAHKLFPSCSIQCSVQNKKKQKNNKCRTKTDIIDEHDFARFEFKISFGQISYTA